MINFELIDLSHTLEENIPTWDGEIGYRLDTTLDYQGCTSEVKFCVQRLALNAGVGTHMDAPAHCFKGSSTVAELPLNSLLLPAVVIDLRQQVTMANYQVCLADLARFEAQYGAIKAGSAVFFYTGWDRYWSEPTKYRNNLCFPTVQLAVVERLLAQNIAALGIDTLSPDLPEQGFLVHKIWLSAGKILLENVANLQHLAAIGDAVFIVPLKLKGATESPIRLIGFKGLTL